MFEGLAEKIDNVVIPLDGEALIEILAIRECLAAKIADAVRSVEAPVAGPTPPTPPMTA
jgi:hypothetical protein